MATTTNYGWVTPDDTALVKDGAAAIRTLGTSADTTVYNNSLATINKTIVDAKGDIIAATAADTVARLAVGATNGMVLTVDSAEATGLKYALPTGGANFTLLNAGGTALTGAATITVSGISGKDKIMVVVRGGSAALVGTSLSLRFNADSAGNYNAFGASNGYDTTYIAANFSGYDGFTATEIPLVYFAGAHTTTANGYVFVQGANAAGNKIFQTSFGVSGASKIGYQVGGFYDSASTISSISILSDNGNLDGGTVFVYTSA